MQMLLGPGAPRPGEWPPPRDLPAPPRRLPSPPESLEALEPPELYDAPELEVHGATLMMQVLRSMMQVLFRLTL